MFEAIPFMTLMKELSFIFDIHLPKTEVSCKLFEYNQGFIAVAESNKFSPRKKLLLSNIISEALYKIILFVYVIYTREHTEEIFTKPIKKYYSYIYR